MNASPNAPGLRPIGVYWDIDNCQIPKGKSATNVVIKIRQNIVRPLNCREFQFVCCCDIFKLPEKICEELNYSGVTIVHVPTVRKNTAVAKLKQEMTKFVESFRSMAMLVLISGDSSFVSSLVGFRDVFGVKIIVVYSLWASNELVSCANVAVHSYASLCSELPDETRPVRGSNEVNQSCDGVVRSTSFASERRSQNVSKQIMYRLVVSGFSTKLSAFDIRGHVLTQIGDILPKSMHIRNAIVNLRYTQREQVELAAHKLRSLKIGKKYVSVVLAKKAKIVREDQVDANSLYEIY